MGGYLKAQKRVLTITLEAQMKFIKFMEFIQR
jgi:hypothetical protein